MELHAQDLYTKAWNFASRAHKGQKVPGSDLPYITHVGNVAIEVMSAIAMSSSVHDPDLAIQCALLHDVLEDTRVTYEHLNTEFGQDVADGVLALTKNPDLKNKADKMQDSLNRIMKQPAEVWIVKLADRIVNLQPPPKHWTKVKIREYHEEAINIHTVLGSANEVLASRLLDKIKSYGSHQDRVGNKAQ
jgi:(p)ppGpp synthase/HD superfamily hydrolase